MRPQRLRFDILTDTGGDFQQLSGITGGFIFQVQFSPDTGAPLDTGARLKLEALNQDGSAFTVADFEHVGSGGSLAKWTRALRIGAYDTGGDAIDGASQAPLVAPGDQLRLTVTQSDGATGGARGKLFVMAGW